MRRLLALSPALFLSLLLHPGSVQAQPPSAPLPPCVDGQYNQNEAGVTCRITSETTPTAFCYDGTWDYSRSMFGCLGHGGVVFFVTTTAVPLSTAVTSPVTTTSPSATTASSPVTTSTSPPGATGPISVSASLSPANCSGGMVTISATVTDAAGHGVTDASVNGTVQTQTTTMNFGFPSTTSAGTTSTMVSISQPTAGANVMWTVNASASGFSASTTVTCSPP